MQEKDYIQQYLGDSIIESVKDFVDRTDLNNNEKSAKIQSYLIHELDFIHLGTGTNRVAMKKDGLVFKIALDQYGVIDNRVEFFVSDYEYKLAAEEEEENLDLDERESIAEYLPATYVMEDRGLVLISEYVDVFELDDFHTRKREILNMLKKVYERYIFEDVGYSDNNYKNFGLRNGELVILDYGYLKPKNLIDMTCPVCKFGTLSFNKLFTKLECGYCSNQERPISILKNRKEIPKKKSKKSDFDISEFIDDDDITVENIDALDLGTAFDVFVNNLRY